MNDTHYKDPIGPVEWQEAVDAAEAARLEHAGYVRGLRTAIPPINIARCLDILRRGRAIRVFPAAERVERMLDEFKRAYILEKPRR